MNAKNDNAEFLPTAYEVPPKPSNYTKLTEGAHRLRILTSPVLGWEVWTDSNDGRIVTRYAYEAAHPNNAKHFWAMVVYNFDQERIQILSIAQSTIQNQLKSLALNVDWGSPLNYNITITRKGTGLNDTEYRVDGSPTSIGKPIPEAILKAQDAAAVDMAKWMKGEEAFSNADTSGKSFSEQFPDRTDADVAHAESDSIPF